MLIPCIQLLCGYIDNRFIGQLIFWYNKIEKDVKSRCYSSLIFNAYQKQFSIGRKFQYIKFSLKPTKYHKHMTNIIYRRRPKNKLKGNILKMGASVVWFSPFYSLKRLFNWVSMILHQVFVFTMNISTILIFASYPLINSHRNLYLNPMRCKKNLIVAKILIYSKTSIIYSFSTAKRLKSTMNINIYILTPTCG